MALALIDSNIKNNDTAVPIDTEIKLEFSLPLELFSIARGISVYTLGSQTWTGSLLSQMDAKTSDVTSTTDQIELVDYTYKIDGSTVTIKPLTQLNKKTKYFIQIAPGTDPYRFLTTSTFDEASYTYIDASDGIVEITKPYIGKDNLIYTLNFTDTNEFDLSVNDIYVDSYTFNYNEEFLLNKQVHISINGSFEDGDIASLNLYAPQGTDSLIKISFTTSDYVESTVKSINIEDKLLSFNTNNFKIVSTIPSNNSLNNSRINPVIIRFNRDISHLDPYELMEKIRIFKVNLDSGTTKNITFQPRIKGRELKLYMISTNSLSEIGNLPIYEVMNNLAPNTEYQFI